MPGKPDEKHKQPWNKDHEDSTRQWIDHEGQEIKTTVRVVLVVEAFKD